ncbi:MAG: hypothetical protein CVU49_02160 [Candidatus Cloacimonetes bacterium HGW-Cloacimonetes-2]|jgi:hypothetical protein|nr:MAG: hypothetical protein CVU49_02160 [Candidatus Cloacimonetes bacterium HGW-Cloacimonetes-2]
MKRFFLVLWIVLLCLVPELALAQEEPAENSEQSSFQITLDLYPGFSMILERDEAWRANANISYGLGLVFQPYDSFELRAGINDQLHSATKRYIHPYPYMLDMDLKIASRAVRIFTSGNWTINTHNPRQDIYLGVGVYTDLIHSATARKTITYVPGDQVERIGISDSFEALTPGAQVQIGIRAEKSRWELRFWSDINTFKVPGTPAGNMRRAFIGLNYSINLYNPKEEASR